MEDCDSYQQGKIFQQLFGWDQAPAFILECWVEISFQTPSPGICLRPNSTSEKVLQMVTPPQGE